MRTPFVWTHGMPSAVSSRCLVGVWPTLKLPLDEPPIKFRHIFHRTIIRTVSQTCLNGKFARHLYTMLVILSIFWGFGWKNQKVSCKLSSDNHPATAVSGHICSSLFFHVPFRRPLKLVLGGLALHFRTAHGVAGQHISMSGPFGMFSAHYSKHWI